MCQAGNINDSELLDRKDPVPFHETEKNSFACVLFLVYSTSNFAESLKLMKTLRNQ
ncbi:unnamed protein product [Larinioides sclopetarius]